MAATTRPSSTIWQPVTIYLVAVAIVSMGLVELQPALGLSTEVLSIVQFGPAIAALAAWGLSRRRVTDALPSPVSKRQVLAHTLLAVAAYVLFGMVLTGATEFGGLPLADTAAPEGVAFSLFLLLQLIGAAGEEVGWRGLFQPLLERRMSRFAACLVTGVVWAAWHVHVFAFGPAVIACFVVSTIAIAVLLGHLANGSLWQRVITAAVGHWLINIALYLVSGEDGFDWPRIGYQLVASIVVTVVFLALFAVARRRRAAAA